MSEAMLVRYEEQDGVAIVELCAPPANTYSYEMMRQIDDAVLRARFDRSVHVIVIRGHGDRFFCAGADIDMLRNAEADFKYHFCLHANETLLRLEHTPKLVIAALNGHAVGGGLEIALAADLRVAPRGGGKIGLPEVHLGVLPGTGGTQRLARVVGRSKAIELMASGRNFDVEEAVELGLVNRILDGDDFASATLEFAKEFTPPGRAARAVGLIKRAVQSGVEAGLLEGLALERELQQRLFESDDAREGLAAYLEKRKPNFTGG
jgi:enoyl-CoA hydratase/carnithine racemase